MPAKVPAAGAPTLKKFVTADQILPAAVKGAGKMLEPAYMARWAINPATGETALTKLGEFSATRDYIPEHHELIASQGWPTAGQAYDLMHRGTATIARNGKVLDLGDQSGQGLEEFMATYGTRTGYRPINNDQAKDLVDALGKQFKAGAIIRAPK